MAKLIYEMITSLDGYVADAQGGFDWAVPDEEVHRFINDQARTIGTYLYGRRMYELMLYWEDATAFAGEPDYVRDFAAICQAADKVVYSRTLERPASARTRVEREFDPEAVRRLKARAERDIAVAGPELAGQAIAAGLVDELRLYVAPAVTGGGKPALPHGVRLDLELLDERGFGGGMAYLRYGITEVRRDDGR
jgi:dihydrofolate reductase